jgi:hypothetical protein
MSWTTRTPFGRKLGADKKRPEDWLGTVSVLAEATPGNLKAARRHLQEANPNDFEQSGRVWVDKGSRQTYRLVHGQPLATPRPDRTCDLFLAVDGYLVFLQREGGDVEETVEVGSVGGRKATVHDPVASDEPVVY